MLFVDFLRAAAEAGDMIFLATIRNTAKTLFRSWTFLLALAVFAGMAVREGLADYVTYAPGYEPKVLAYATYVQGIDHRMSNLLLLAFPFFAIVVTALVLNRDYGDRFFEIEKAAGVKPARYLLGRLCAVVAVSCAAQWGFGTLCMGLYVFRWGGVYGLSVSQFVIDCALRQFRLTLCAALPLVLFCVGLIYLLGATFHSSFAAAVGGLGLAVGNYAFTFLYQYRAFAAYFDYFSPVPKMLFRYVVFYNVPEQSLQRMGATLETALLCAGWLVGVFALCGAGAYCLVRKREI